MEPHDNVVPEGVQEEFAMNARGIDHLAVVSDGMPAPMDFHTRVLGFRLVHVRRVPYELPV
jgi:hypothetical protein